MAEEKITLIAALEDVTTKQHGGTEITSGRYKGHEVILTESGNWLNADRKYPPDLKFSGTQIFCTGEFFYTVSMI